MNKYIEAIKRLPRNFKIAVVSGFCIIVVGIVIFMIVQANTNYRDDTLVKVNNYSNDSTLPDNFRYLIEDRLTSIVQYKANMPNLNITDAVIRNGTYEEMNIAGNSYSGQFIVDVESLHYSFLVKASWVKDTDYDEDPDITIYCPHYMDVIYKDKKCIAESPEQQLKKYLPHYGRVDGVKFAVSYVTNSTESYVAVEAPACKNAALLDKAIDKTKKWIKSIYLDPNDYEYNVKNTCRE